MINLRELVVLKKQYLTQIAAAFFLISFTFACEAQVLDCSEVQSLKVGDYLHGQTETQLSTLTLRTQGEPSSVGHAAVKGAMARRISGELSGMPVVWSTATVIGPVLCLGMNAYKILVDPRNIRIVDGEKRVSFP